MENNQKIDINETINEKPKKQDSFLVDFAKLGETIKNNKTLKDKRRGLRGKKKAMILALVKTLGVVSRAADMVKINNATHYTWMKEDKRYARAVEESKNVVDDYLETSLLSLALEKNPQVLLHIAKTKLKYRGYGEKQEIEHSAKEGIKFIIERQDERVPSETE